MALKLAAAVEAGSKHQIAAALPAGARDRGLDIPAARDSRAVPGAGMEAVIDDRALHIGRTSDADRSDPQAGAAVAGAESEGCTAVVLREDTRPLAVLAVADQLHPGAHSTIAELLLEDKSAAVRELREQYGVIAMVGDAVNDALWPTRT